MRSRTLLSLFICLFAIATRAQAPVGGANVRIAVVAFNAAVLRTTEAQREVSALQTKFAPRENHLEALNTQVESLKKQLTDGAKPLSEAERTEKVKSLDGLQRQLQREGEDFKNNTDSASQQMFQTVAQKLFTFLQQYAGRHGYTVVLDRGPNETPAVWYAASGVDITSDLVSAYNSKSPATPSSTLPSAPAP